MHEELRESVIQRVLSTLLQQKMVTELDDVRVSSSQTFDELLQRTANDGVMKPAVARRILAFFTRYLREQKDSVCSCTSHKTQSSTRDAQHINAAKVTGILTWQ